MISRLWAAGLLALLCACGGTGDQGAQEAGAPASEPIALRKDADSKAPQASIPQIAYTYRYTFRLPSSAVASTQDEHLKLCEQFGVARCRVANLERSASSGQYLSGSTTLLVAAPIARAFGDRAVAMAARAGADTVDRGIEGEDLSKQIVDTDARIRTKQALVDRLTILLQTRSGNMQQAVEAERAINAAQEELEQARSWLAEMRGRVAMSTITLRYESAAPLGGGFIEPIRASFAQMGNLFGQSLGLIIMVVAALLPWAILVGLVLLAVRALRRRLPHLDWRKPGTDGSDTETAPGG